jgi:glyoxylase-like metal-dependent hydrolase (beta-lactamase superfamily II)
MLGLLTCPRRTDSRGPALQLAAVMSAATRYSRPPARDVRHIVITHFDVDHIGGLSDFPHARVHVTAAEALASMIAPSWREKLRYEAAQWAHGLKIVEHTPDGERWRGFAAAKELDEISPGIVLLSLPGHTRGHACVAVDAGDRWILHAGDAFCHHGTLDGRSPVPTSLRAMERMIAYDIRRVRANHARLAELCQRGEPDLVIVTPTTGHFWTRRAQDTLREPDGTPTGQGQGAGRPSTAPDTRTTRGLLGERRTKASADGPGAWPDVTHGRVRSRQPAPCPRPQPAGQENIGLRRTLALYGRAVAGPLIWVWFRRARGHRVGGGSSRRTSRGGRPRCPCGPLLAAG